MTQQLFYPISYLPPRNEPGAVTKKAPGSSPGAPPGACPGTMLLTSPARQVSSPRDTIPAAALRSSTASVAMPRHQSQQNSVAQRDIPKEQPPQSRSASVPGATLAMPPGAPGQWESFARRDMSRDSTEASFSAGKIHSAAGARRGIPRRRSCDDSLESQTDEKIAYLPLSRTTDRVLRILLDGDLSRVRAESVAESLGISCTTLRRRLRNDHTSYQFLLDRARQFRCESRLRERWLPGKCLADELGYLEVNSFYRAFRRWTGFSYSDYRQMYY